MEDLHHLELHRGWHERALGLLVERVAVLVVPPDHHRLTAVAVDVFDALHAPAPGHDAAVFAQPVEGDCVVLPHHAVSDDASARDASLILRSVQVEPTRVPLLRLGYWHPLPPFGSSGPSPSSRPRAAIAGQIAPPGRRVLDIARCREGRPCARCRPYRTSRSAAARSASRCRCLSRRGPASPHFAWTPYCPASRTIRRTAVGEVSICLASSMFASLTGMPVARSLFWASTVRPRRIAASSMSSTSRASSISLVATRAASTSSSMAATW